MYLQEKLGSWGFFFGGLGKCKTEAGDKRTERHYQQILVPLWLIWHKIPSVKLHLHFLIDMLLMSEVYTYPSPNNSIFLWIWDRDLRTVITLNSGLQVSDIIAAVSRVDVWAGKIVSE